ncbi:MAG: hypothetical protein L0Y75_10790 [Acidobacteria bacterium]|nr:hypothetical protein [Acidobacteriota bacterium]
MVEAATKDEAIEKAKAAAEALLARSDIVQIEINGGAGHNGDALQNSFALMWANDETFDDFLSALKAYRAQLNAQAEEEAKNRFIGIYSGLDDETWNQFQTAMKEAREETDAEPNRL